MSYPSGLNSEEPPWTGWSAISWRRSMLYSAFIMAARFWSALFRGSYSLDMTMIM